MDVSLIYLPDEPPLSLWSSGESVENSIATSEQIKKSPLSPSSLAQATGLRSPSKLLHHTHSTGGKTHSFRETLLMSM